MRQKIGYERETRLIFTVPNKTPEITFRKTTYKTK
jgi:hypothetical protein